MNTVVNLNKIAKREKILPEVIELLLTLKSENTQKAYRKTYNDFFGYFFNKSIQLISWEDISTLDYIDIIEYTKHLELSCKVTSIKSKLGALQFLSKELNKIKPNSINGSMFYIDLKNKEKSNQYGALTKEEVNNLLEYCKGIDTQKYLFFKLMLSTAHRVNSLLSLKWGDIKLISQNNKTIPILSIYDKTNHFETPISLDLYNELKNNLYQDNDDEKVFNINNMALCRILKSFCEKYNIDKDRNIVVHSIKKTSGDLVYEKTNGDINLTAKHLKHSNIETAYKHYIGKNNNLEENPSFTLLEQNNIDDKLQDITNNLSKDDLMKIILNLDELTKNKIYNNIKNTL